MADLNFPQTPQIGDTYSIGSRTWVWNGNAWVLQSGIISTNPFIVVSAQITTSTNSTSTNSGALIVEGGAGFGKDVWAKNIYSNGQLVVTTATLSGYGVSAIYAGDDINVSNPIGEVTISNTSTLQTVTSRGSTTTNAITIKSTTDSTSTTTGALVVSGGIGLGGNIYSDGLGKFASGVITNKITSENSSATLFDSTQLNIAVGGLSTVISVASTVSSQDSLTGALVVAGGVGVGGSVYANQLYDNTRRVLTRVYPAAGTAISISNVSTSNDTTSFTINNEGVITAVGTTYLGVSSAVGNVTFTNLGVQTLTAGTDTAVSANTGTITVWSTSTLQSITNRGAETLNAIKISNTSASTTSTDGALVVSGGVGVGGNVNVGGTLNVWGPVTFSSPVTFSGTATYVYSTNTVYTDNLIEIHVPTSGVDGIWEADDGKDVGFRFHYYNRTLATGTDAALVLANDSQWLEFYSSGAESAGGVFTGSTVYGKFKTGSIKLADTTLNNQNTTTGALQIAGGVAINGNQFIAGTGSTGSNVAVSNQSLRVEANGIGVNGDSYFTNNLGVGGTLTPSNIDVASTAIFRGPTTANSTFGVNGNFNVTGTSLLSGDVNAQTSLGVTGNFNVTGTTTLVGITQISNITESGSTNTGALQVVGGLGVGGNVNIGGNVYVAGVINATVEGSISTATHISAGSLGAIPYQTAFGRTSFFGPGDAGNVLVSQGAAQPQYQNTLTLAGTVAATNTMSGTLQVRGGVGIGGALYANTTSFVAGSEIVTTSTINIYASKTFVFAGTDTAVSTSSGNITVWSTSTLQSITNRGAQTTNAISITNTTNSTSTQSGALIVLGGIGIGQNLTVGGNSTLIGNAYAESNVGIKGNIAVTGTSVLIGNVYNDANVGIKGNLAITGTSVLVGSVYADSNVGIKGNLAITGTTVLTGLVSGSSAVFSGQLGITGTTTLSGPVNIGSASQQTSYQSPTTTTNATIDLESFNSTQYRTAKYICQVVDNGITPNKVHISELLVFHDNNGVSTQPYIIQYGIGTNTGELGSWDVVYNSGTITLQFTPNYTPGALTVKVVRTSITL